MQNKGFILALLALIMIIPVKLSAQYNVKQFYKLYALEGTWHMSTDKGETFEVWQIMNDIFLQNSSFNVQGKDTIQNESVQLRYKDGIITYTPTVRNQNHGKPVSFKLISIKGNQFVFENKKHDFPQRITYKITNKNSLLATISGTTKSGYKQIPFVFKKVE
jgi:hypothetical protein